MYMMKMMDERDQVMGEAQYTRVMVWEMEMATVMYETRNTHQAPSITAIGTIALPAPLITPAMECDRAKRQ